MTKIYILDTMMTCEVKGFQAWKVIQYEIHGGKWEL